MFLHTMADVAIKTKRKRRQLPDPDDGVDVLNRRSRRYRKQKQELVSFDLAVAERLKNKAAGLGMTISELATFLLDTADSLNISQAILRLKKRAASAKISSEDKNEGEFVLAAEPVKKKRGRPRKHPKKEEEVNSCRTKLALRVKQAEPPFQESCRDIPAIQVADWNCDGSASSSSPLVQSARLAFTRALQQSCNANAFDQDQVLYSQHDTSLIEQPLGSTSRTATDGPDGCPLSFEQSHENHQIMLEPASSISQNLNQVPVNGDSNAYQPNVKVIFVRRIHSLPGNHDAECIRNDVPSLSGTDGVSPTKNAESSGELPPDTSDGRISTLTELSTATDTDHQKGDGVKVAAAQTSSLPGPDESLTSRSSQLMSNDGSSVSIKVPDPSRRSRLNQITGGLLDRLRRKAESESAQL